MKITLRYGLMTFLMAAGLLAACGNDQRFDNSVSAPPAPSLNAAQGEPTPASLNIAEIGERAQRLIDMCVAENADRLNCTCRVKAAEDTLERSDFIKMIELAEAGDEAGARSVLSDILSSDPDKAAKVLGYMLTCAEQ